MNVLIFADNRFQAKRLGILRAPGAHRIATHLREQDIKTEVIDFYLDWSQDEIKQIIDLAVNNKTLFVGFSCSLMFDGVEEFAFIRDYIRSQYPAVAIVIGGYGTTQKGFDNADYYLEGYSEYAVTALVNHLRDSTNEIKFNVDDTGRKVIYTKDLYPVNKLTSLRINYTPSDFIQGAETLSLETARGCIFKCKFCSFQLLGKKKVDYLRDPGEIRDELIHNYEQYGTTKYIVTEDTFNDSSDKVDMLYNITQSLPFKLKLMGYMRADLLAARPQDIPKLMASGFDSMHFGIETFNDKAGQAIGKGMSAIKLKETLIKLKKDYPQLYVNGTFIVGLPNESDADIRDTAQWLIDSNAIDFWTFNPLMIPKKNKLIYSSEFTDNYLMYGYNKMTEIEIEKGTLDHKIVLFGTKVMPYIILWKNKFFNYFSAGDLTNEINQQSNAYKKIDAWTTFAIAGLGYNLSDVQQHSYSGNNPLDQELINKQTTDFINNYKINKLKWLTNNVVPYTI